METLAGLLPFILIVVVFYLLLIRPTRNRQREMTRMQGELRPGQQIMTSSGLYATVVALDDDSVTLETAPGVTSRWTRGAVARIVTPLQQEPGLPDRSPDRSAGPDRSPDRSPDRGPDRSPDRGPDRGEEPRSDGTGPAV